MSADDSDQSDPPLSIKQAIARQFYTWEARGRGWLLWDEPVTPEPPFVPFFWRPVQTQVIDDGRQHTLLSGLTQWLNRLFTGSAKQRESDDADEDVDAELVSPQEPVSWIELRATVPASLNVSKKAAEQLLLSLSSCHFPLSFELIGLPESTIVQIACGDSDRGQVRQQLEAYFPEAVVTEGQGFLTERWEELDDTETVVAEFGLSREFMLPLASPRNFENDPLIGIVGALSDVGEDEIALFQVLFQPVRHPWAESLLRSVTFADGSDLFQSPRSFLELTKEKVSRPLYGVVMRAACRSREEGRAWELARRLAGALLPLSDPSGNELIPLENDGYDAQDHEQDVPLRRCQRSGMLLNSDELVALVHLPSAIVRSSKLRGEPKNTKTAPALVLNGSLALGENEHNGQTRIVSLSPEQRVKHVHVIGASGTGKSTFLLNLILQDIVRGEGVGVLDPHGDLIDAILDRIPEHRIPDVVLVDPSDEAFPVGFNILAAHSETEKTMLASDLVAVFRRLSTSWGDQMNSILANGVLAILESDRGGTLADLRRLLVEKPFREDFLKSVRDEQVVYYWKKEFPMLTGRPQGPVLTRLDSFLRPKAIRYMVCQKANRLDFADIMDGRKIFLARLSHGAIGEENAHLLGALLVSKFHQIALGRQQMKESQRKDFWLYVDEFHHFATPSMAALLSGVRKYRLGLVLAHQELHQLETRSPDVASAVTANAYTRVCFRLGDQDARKLESGFSNFTAKDLQNLGIGEAVCRVERSDFDFNLRTSPLPKPDPEASERIREQVIAHSRNQYAIAREVVEQQLRQSVEPSVEPVNEALEPLTPKEKVKPPTIPVQEPTPVEIKPDPTTQPVDPPRRKRSDKDEPTVPEEEKLPGRGGPQHKYLQQLIKQWGDGMGYRSSIEKEILGGEGSIDVALEKPGRMIACLISVTTGEEWELASVRKCLRAGYERIVMVCPESKHLSKLQKPIEAGVEQAERSKISFMMPEQFFAFVQELEVQSMQKEKTLRGYKVKTNFRAMNDGEGDVRRQAISQVVAKALKRTSDRKQNK